MSIKHIGIAEHAYMPAYSSSSGGNGNCLPDQEMRAHRHKDRVSISPEAQQMARGSVATGCPEKSDTESLKMKFTSPDENSSAAKEKAKGRDIWRLLMESLFMAELEDNNCLRAEPQKEGDVLNEAPERLVSVNPLRDGARTAELKQVIADIMTGKAGLEDLPEALATGKSGRSSSRKEGPENSHAAGAAGRNASGSDTDSGSRRMRNDS